MRRVCGRRARCRYPNSANAFKALVAAELGGVAGEIEVPAFNMGVDNRTPSFLRLNPHGKVPTLELEDGTGVFESNAIARYVARVSTKGALLGASPRTYACVEQWLDFGQNEVQAPLASWLYPLLGFRPYDKAREDKAKAQLKKALLVLEKVLAGTPFLAGEGLTLADVVLCCGSLPGWLKLFDAEYRADLPKLTAYVQRCYAMPEFAKHVGNVQLCDKALTK